MKRLLEYSDLNDLGVSFSNRHLMRLEAAGKFPCRIKISERCTRWDGEKVMSWIQERLDQA